MRFCWALVLCAVAFVLPALAQNPASETVWLTAKELPQVDLSGLTPEQKTLALKALRKESCTCGCQMRVAQCRVEDPSCGDSKTLASTVVAAVKDGKSADQIHTILEKSSLAKMRAEQNRILSDPIQIPVAGSPVRGPHNARITLIEFSDFECPYCSRAISTIAGLLHAYPNDAKLIYKEFPLELHPHARMAAAAALAAADQGKFWEMHDKLFANYNRLSQERINELAQEAGLDMERFRKDIASGKYETHIERDINDGQQAGVQGTPTLFVNGKRYNGPISEAALKPILEAELKSSGQVAQAR